MKITLRDLHKSKLVLAGNFETRLGDGVQVRDQYINFVRLDLGCAQVQLHEGLDDKRQLPPGKYRAVVLIFERER